MGHRTVHIIGVPMDHGAGRRGVGMGPAAIRIAGLHRALQRTGRAFVDRGDIVINTPETVSSGDPHYRFAELIRKACDELRETVVEVLENEGLPLVIGGDHSIAIGTIAGLAEYHRKHDQRLGLIWVDAHGDMNTPSTSPSGNIHGMPLSVNLGMDAGDLTELGGFRPKVLPEDTVLIGLRDLDQGERQAIRDSGVHAYTMQDIDERGMAAIMRESIELVTKHCDKFHVSFDIDSLDPRVAPGTGTPVQGGLTYREAHLALELAAETERLGSFELVEVNPILDTSNQTGEVAVGLIASALGRRIL